MDNLSTAGRIYLGIALICGTVSSLLGTYLLIKYTFGI
jgi:hypothetical protein